MKLSSLKVRNFMPYKDHLHIQFPGDDQRNVLLIFGDNMRGKTSILNAIRWVFYGKAIGRHSRPIPLNEIVNKDAALEDDWRVEVQVSFTANGHSYDLRRVANKRKLVATPSKPDDFTTEVFMTRDGAVIQGDQISAEIGFVAPEQISRFFLFDGELLQEYETLLIEDSQQGKQIKEAIEQVLGVPALINGRIELQTILRNAQKQQNKDLSQVKGLETQAKRLDDLTHKREAIDSDIDALKSKLQVVREVRTGLDDELEAAQSIIASKASLDAKTNEQVNIIAEVEKKELERLDLISVAWKELFDSRLRTARKQVEKERAKLYGALKDQTGIQQRVSDLRALLDTEKCPTCKQVVGRERRAEIGEALGMAEAQLESIEDQASAMDRLSVRHDKLAKITSVNARERLRQSEKDLQGLHVRLTHVENEIERLSDEISGYDTAEIGRKRFLQREKVKEEGRLQRDIEDQMNVRDSLQKDLDISQRAIEGLTKSRTQKSTLKVSLCSDLEKIFGQSIERLRDQLRRQVAQRATQAFKQMTTQKGYRGLEINDNYGLRILDEAGRDVAVRSAGAEQVVALSLIDGLNRTGRSPGPVIMDTPFGRLDLEHRDNILKYLPTVTSQFILLVHSGEIRRETDLAVVADRIGGAYEITEINSTQSKIERVAL